MPRLTPQPMAPETARFGTILHTERAARSLKESPPMEVFGSNYGMLRTLNLRSARIRRQSRNGQTKRGRPERSGPIGLPGNSDQRVRSTEGRNPCLRVLTLVVEVERELVGVRTQAEGVHLVLALVVDPGLDDLRREHVALEEERTVALQSLERLVERAGGLGNVLRLLGRHRIDVLVERLARVDLVLDAVEAGHQHRREGDVRVGGRVGAAELEALGLG